MGDKLKVLVACEYSGRVRRAFSEMGHDAWSCDLLESDDGSENHIVGDAIDVAGSAAWDLLIGHPPCTYMANSGVCHLHKDAERWDRLDDAARFFRALWDLPIGRMCLENPVMHKYAKERIGGLKQAQTVQPWMFGHKEQKATCLWLRGLMPLRPTDDVGAETKLLPARERQRLHYLPPSPTRWKERSTTYQGIADAMAMQWGGMVCEEVLHG